MDTNSDYSNIMKAIGSKPSLSMQQQADNYNAFSKLMSEGVYLPDLIKRLDDLEARMKDVESPKAKADLELLAVMEAAVKGEPEVKAARQRVADVKSRIIDDMCRRDPAYVEAVDEYRRAVNSAYVKRSQEQASRRGGASAVRYDEARSLPHQARISCHEAG